MKKTIIVAIAVLLIAAIYEFNQIDGINYFDEKIDYWKPTVSVEKLSRIKSSDVEKWQNDTRPFGRRSANVPPDITGKTITFSPLLQKNVEYHFYFNASGQLINIMRWKNGLPNSQFVFNDDGTLKAKVAGTHNRQ